MGEKIVINQDFFVRPIKCLAQAPYDDIYEIWMIATIGSHSYRQLLCEIDDSYRANSFIERLKAHFESIYILPEWTEVFIARHIKEIL